jgi:outer membrane receptor protein involved in Fe transport
VNDFGIPQIAQIPQTFESDELTNIEVGAKTEWLDSRLLVNIAYFHSEWDNVLVEIRDRTEAFKFLADGGDAEIDGIELEAIAQPAEGLTFNAMLAWTDASLVRSSPFASGVPDPDNPGNPFLDPNAGIVGDDVPNVPEWQFGVSGSYKRPMLNGRADGMIRFDWVYYDERANQYRPFQVDANEQEIMVGGERVPNPFYTKLDSYTLLNASAAISWEGWRTTLFVDNATDERAQIDAIRSNQDPLGFLTVRPRTVGIRISKNF